ncbi:hypothetical protein C8R45DRAFT_937466 [Mycena sanguinolenta]|nr:hypothetical protein C8R45DRAFT_937466 [Mycena sanguinolenta]
MAPGSTPPAISTSGVRTAEHKQRHRRPAAFASVIDVWECVVITLRVCFTAGYSRERGDGGYCARGLFLASPLSVISMRLPSLLSHHKFTVLEKFCTGPSPAHLCDATHCLDLEMLVLCQPLRRVLVSTFISFRFAKHTLRGVEMPRWRRMCDETLRDGGAYAGREYSATFIAAKNARCPLSYTFNTHTYPLIISPFRSLCEPGKWNTERANNNGAGLVPVTPPRTLDLQVYSCSFCIVCILFGSIRFTTEARNSSYETAYIHPVNSQPDCKSGGPGIIKNNASVLTVVVGAETDRRVSPAVDACSRPSEGVALQARIFDKKYTGLKKFTALPPRLRTFVMCMQNSPPLDFLPTAPILYSAKHFEPVASKEN